MQGGILLDTSFVPIGFNSQVIDNDPILRMSMNIGHEIIAYPAPGAAFQIDGRNDTDNPLFQWTAIPLPDTSISNGDTIIFIDIDPKKLMVLNNDGNLGIGTSNPMNRLSVNGAADMNLLQLIATDNETVLEIADTNKTTQWDASLLSQEHFVLNETNVASRFTVRKGGYVGINDLNPTFPLVVSSQFGSGTTLSLANTSTQGGIFNFVSTGQDNDEGAGKLLIRDENQDTVRMTLDQYGNLGIGTLNPTDKLTIAGSINFSDGSGGFYQGNIYNVDEIIGADDIRFSGNPGTTDMLLNAQGNLGIGTFDPMGKLHVVSDKPANDLETAGNFVSNYRGVMANVQTGDNAMVYGVMSIAQSSGPTYGIYSSGNGTTSGNNYGLYSYSNNSGVGNAFGVYGETATGGGPRYAIYGNSPADIVAGVEYAGYFNGDVTVTGVFNNPSDQKLKQNIQSSTYGLETIMNLRPVTYEFRQKEFDFMNLADGAQLGFIAQEMEEVMPQLVHLNHHPLEQGSIDYKAINYQGLIPVMTKAIQEQQEVIGNQENRISDLEIENEELKNKVDDIQSQLDELKTLVGRLIDEKTPQHGSLSSARLDQNEPNPFTRETKIGYFIPDHIKNVELRVYDQQGRLIKAIEIQARGEGETILQTNSLSNGQYYYTLTLDGEVMETKKMILTR